MPPKTKAIIIVAGAVVVFSIFIALIFDLFPSRDSGGGGADRSEEPEIILPDRDELLPENAVFDSSNAGELAALDPSYAHASSQSALEREARELAMFFIERFGTYSSDANFANIDDLAGFMSLSMRDSMENYKKNQPAREGYYSIETDVSSVSAKSFSLKSRAASFDMVLSRTELSSGSVEKYQQAAVLNLVQDGSGNWKIDSVLFGSRL